MRLYILARHAESTLNQQQRVNGDPHVPADLTETGRAQALVLGGEIAALPIDLFVHTRFKRTRDTGEIALGSRAVPAVEEPLFDDVDVGGLEGWTLDEYRAWKREHDRKAPFPGGESLDDAARRYARAFRALLARAERIVLVVAHEIPIRYALNAAAGSNNLDQPAHTLPNARPYLFDDVTLERAAIRIDELAGLS